MLYTENFVANKTEMSVKVSSHPNPFQDKVIIEILATEKEQCIIVVLDVKSNIVSMIGAELSAGVNSVPLTNLGSLAPGSYTVHIKDLDGALLSKVVLMKQ